MVRFLYLLFICFTFGFSEIIAGIALTVNGDPITLYQIKKTQEEKKLDKKAAIDFLISQVIKDQEVKRLKIDVSDSRIDNEIQDIAYRNHLSIDNFFKKIKAQEGLNPQQYKDQLKDQIKTQELMRNILSSNVAGEDEMREYYDKHQEEFNLPKEVIAIRFTSAKMETLQEAMKTPNQGIRGVERAEETIPMDSVPPQVAQIFAATKKGNFTTVLNGGNGSYMAFLIKEKKGEEKIDYQQAKNFIAQKLIEKRQDKILEDYFEKVRQKAVVINLR